MAIKTITAKRYRPSITFSERDLPEIADWKPGERYALVLEVEMNGIANEPDYSQMKPVGLGEAQKTLPKILRGSFEVKAVGVDTDYHQEYARRMAGRK